MTPWQANQIVHNLWTILNFVFERDPLRFQRSNGSLLAIFFSLRSSSACSSVLLNRARMRRARSRPIFLKRWFRWHFLHQPLTPFALRISA